MFYRIQQPGIAVESILDPELQWSCSWSSEDERHGISACESIEALADYFAQTGVALSADCILITFDGDYVEDEDLDAHLGAVLTIPETIIATELADDRFLDMVGAAYDALAA